MNKIKLKYKELNEVSTSLKELKSCLEDANKNLTTIATMFENSNSGEAVNELIDFNSTVISNVLIQKDNIDTSIIVLDDYIYDTSTIIMPSNLDSTVSVNYDSLETNIKTLNTCIEDIEDAKKILGTVPMDNPFVNSDEDTEENRNNSEFNRGQLESVEEDLLILRRKFLDKLEILDGIKQKVKVFIEFDADSAQILRTLNDGKYDVENSSKLTNEGVDLEIEAMVIELKRPDGMSDEEFEKYKREYRNNITDLKSEGWDRDAIIFYTEHIENNSKSIYDLRKSFAETREIGSELFTSMYDASSKEEIDKVHFVIDLMGGEYDEFGNLILKNPTSSGRPALKFDSKLYPDSRFFELFAKSVSSSYMDSNTEFFNVDGKYDRVHQFRYYIDKHNIEYIRTEFKDEGESDYKALLDYSKWLVYNDMSIESLYFGSLDNARLHKRGEQTNNSKWMNQNGYSEFILDENGNFVTMWDTIKVSKSGDLNLKIGGYIIPYKKIRVDNFGELKDILNMKLKKNGVTEDEIKSALLEIANTGSFNYSGHYDYGQESFTIHKGLDMDSGDFEPQLRAIIKRKYKAPTKNEHETGRSDELGDILNEEDFKEK